MTSDVIADFREALRHRRFWLLFGMHDANARFDRTAIGAFFYSLNTLMRVGIIYVVFGPYLGKGDPYFFGYVALGIPLFALISASITQGYSILSKNRSIMQNMPMPVFTFVFRFMTGQLVRLAFSLLVYVGFVILNPEIMNVEIAWLVVTVPIFVLLMMSIAVFCMVFGAFFPNLFEFLNAGMGIMFFATPVFWHEESRHGVRGALAHYNPFSHMLAIVREPALGHAPSLVSLGVCVGLMVSTVAVASYLFNLSRSWLIYRV